MKTLIGLKKYDETIQLFDNAIHSFPVGQNIIMIGLRNIVYLAKMKETTCQKEKLTYRNKIFEYQNFHNFKLTQIQFQCELNYYSNLKDINPFFKSSIEK